MDYCDICDSKLTLRKDDNEETARARFVTYERETAPLYDYFKQMGILKEIKQPPYRCWAGGLNGGISRWERGAWREKVHRQW